MHDVDVKIRRMIAIVDPESRTAEALECGHGDRLAINLERKALFHAGNQNGAAILVYDRLVFADLHVVQVKTQVVAIEFNASLAITVGSDYNYFYLVVDLLAAERVGSEQASSNEYRCLVEIHKSIPLLDVFALLMHDGPFSSHYETHALLCCRQSFTLVPCVVHCAGDVMKNWGIYVVIALGYFIYQVSSEVDRDSTGTIVGEGNIDAFTIRVGDCFDDSSSFDDEVTSLPGVPCSEPHDNEAFAVVNLTIASYPKGGAMIELANETCRDRFESFVGRDYESSSLDIFTLYPTVESWAQNDREVVCAVYEMDASKLVGTMKGRGL